MPTCKMTVTCPVFVRVESCFSDEGLQALLFFTFEIVF